MSRKDSTVCGGCNHRAGFDAMPTVVVSGRVYPPGDGSTRGGKRVQGGPCEGTPEGKARGEALRVNNPAPAFDPSVAPPNDVACHPRREG